MHLSGTHIRHSGDKCSLLHRPKTNSSSQMDLRRTRSLSSLQVNGKVSQARPSQTTLRHVVSLSTSGRLLTLIPEEEDHTTATTDGGQISRTTSSNTVMSASGRARALTARSRLRRIASKPSRMLSTNSGTGASEKGNDTTGRPAMGRLRRMASMRAGSLRRMPSQPLVHSEDADQSEAETSMRTRSWSGPSRTVRAGPSRWFSRLVSVLSEQPAAPPTPGKNGSSADDPILEAQRFRCITSITRICEGCTRGTPSSTGSFYDSGARA